MARENLPQPASELPLRPSDNDLDELNTLDLRTMQFHWGMSDTLPFETHKAYLAGPDGLCDMDHFQLDILGVGYGMALLDQKDTLSREARDELRLDRSDDVLRMFEEETKAVPARREP